MYSIKSTNLYKISVSFSHRYGYPLLSLIKRDFKTRYSPTFLGLGWTVLQPLIFILIYTFVFSFILKVKLDPESGNTVFVLYLVSGFLPFMALAEGITQGSICLKENKSLLDKVIFPAPVLPIVGVVIAAINEIIGLTLFIVISFFFGVRPSWWLLLLPLFILLKILFTIGISWLVSVLNVFITDLGQFLGLAITAWMFFSPIFYPVSAVPNFLLWLLKINPLYHFITSYRAILLYGQNPLKNLWILLIITFITLIFGLWFFKKTIERAKDFL
jgi:ABC-type polysaccharide/polyol phosphate export permease